MLSRCRDHTAARTTLGSALWASIATSFCRGFAN
jgi:hypothetical protein